jgi:plasmid stabilization system protein ParE
VPVPPTFFARLCDRTHGSASGGNSILPQLRKEHTMPQGDKSAYTDKQKRRAEHIEEGYESRGVSRREAERRAWATVNKEDKGGKKSGSGRGKKSNRSASRKGGWKGGAASASRPKAARSASARKAAATRKRRASSSSRSSRSKRPSGSRRSTRSRR